MKGSLDKTKIWEKRRRDRLKESFHHLAQLLPQYDPARIPSQKDILDKATQFVKELRLSNSRLLVNQTQTDEKNKLIQELKDEVNRLILRVKQLTTLLKQANISIPNGPSLKSLGKRKLKWSEKLAPDDVENKRCRLNPKDSSSKEINRDLDTTQSSTPAAPLRETNPLANSDKDQPEITPLSEVATSRETSNQANVLPSLLPGGTSCPPQVPQVVQSIAPVHTLTFSLPVQTSPTTTIILTPQSLPVSPLLTRISLPTHRILPKPNHPSQMPKLPVLRVTQPIIKYKRTRNRKKKVVPPKVESLKPPPIPLTPAPSTTESTSPTTSEAAKQAKESATESEPKSIQDKPTQPEEPVDKTETMPAQTSQEEHPVISIIEVDLTEETSVDTALEVRNTENTAVVQPDLELRPHEPKSLQPQDQTAVEHPNSSSEIEIPQPNLSDSCVPPVEIKDSPKKSSEVAHVTTELEVAVDKEPQIELTSTSSEPKILKEATSELIVPVQQKEISAATCENNPVPVCVTEPEQVIRSPKESEPALPNPIIVEPVIEETTVTTTSSVPQAVNLSESLQEIADLMQPPSNPPPAKPDRIISEESVTSDKISECIARSIDLIDQPEAELMELSGDWGESHSPKSPISPTQMFLSMFPLLPRESVISTSEHANPKQPFTSGGKSSSFYIDSMLPDESSSDNFATRNANITNSTSTIPTVSTNLNIANLLSSSTTPTIEPLPQVSASFTAVEISEAADNSNPFSISSISTPIRSGSLYPMTSSSQSKAQTNRSSDFDFVLSPYNSLLSSSYNTTSSINKDINWQPFQLPQSVAPVVPSRSSSQDMPAKRTEQAAPPPTTAASSSSTPRKVKSSGKELSTYKPYASAGPTVREVTSHNQVPVSTERSGTPRRSKAQAKTQQSPSRKQQKDSSLSTPQKTSIADIYTPYPFHGHQPYQTPPVPPPPPPPPPPIPPAPSDPPFTPYFQPAAVPEIASSSRSNKTVLPRDAQESIRSADSSRKRTQTLQTNNPNAPPSLELPSANFYENILPQPIHSQLSLAHGSKSQRHNQPFYLPDVPLQNFDFMQHAIPPPQLFTNKTSGSRSTHHQQIDKYNYFTAPPSAPTDFNYHANLGIMEGSLYSQQGQSSSSSQKKSSATVDGVEQNRGSQQPCSNQMMSTSHAHQVPNQRQVRGKSPATQSEQQTRQHEPSRASNTQRQDTHSNVHQRRDTNPTHGSQIQNPPGQNNQQKLTSHRHEGHHGVSTTAHPETHAQRQDQQPVQRQRSEQAQSDNQAHQNVTLPAAAASMRDHNVHGSSAHPHYNVHRESQRHQEYQQSHSQHNMNQIHPHQQTVQQSRSHVHQQTPSNPQQSRRKSENPPYHQNPTQQHAHPHQLPHAQQQSQTIPQQQSQAIPQQQSQTIPQQQSQNIPQQPSQTIPQQQQHQSQQTHPQPSHHTQQILSHSTPHGHNNNQRLPSQNHHQIQNHPSHSQYQQQQTSLAPNLQPVVVAHVQNTQQQRRGNQQQQTPSQQQQHHAKSSSQSQSSQNNTRTQNPQQHVQMHSHSHTPSNQTSNQQVPGGHTHHQQTPMYPQSNTASTQQQHHNNNTRPVNWMTDPPTSQQAATCSRKSNTSTIPNPFSVSKLVGNSSPSTSQNSNYCVEGLIRKNNPNEWHHEFSQPSSVSCVHSQTGASGPHNQLPPSFPTYQTQPDYSSSGNYSNFTHHSHPNHHQHHHAHYTPTSTHPPTTHFEQFGHNLHHHHQQQVRHHGTNSSMNSHPHSNTSGDAPGSQQQQSNQQGSSVLNFNLSSIFPEMNDKRSNAASNNTNNSTFYSGTKQ